MKPNAREFKDIILNVKQPYKLTNFKLNWPCFDMTIEEWLKLFDEYGNASTGNGYDFDIGKLQHSRQPQWEKYCTKTKMKMSEFLENYKINNLLQNNWASYSYKRLNDSPIECSKGIDFSELGFDNIEDITFWLGSKGAHTTCHYDTYGSNIVVQIFGKKSWLLFPPDTELDCTRVPYEESSVYCKQNFYSPSELKSFKEISGKAYHIILEPGDILIVPSKWWHYAENLEISFSINTWIKLETDLESSVEECLTKLQIFQCTKSISADVLTKLIFRNEKHDIMNSSQEELLRLLENLTEFYLNPDLYPEIKENRHNVNYLSKNDFEDLILKFKDVIIPLQNLDEKDFFDILIKNSFRYSSNLEDDEDKELIGLTNLINSLCHPKVIALIKNWYFIERIKK